MSFTVSYIKSAEDCDKCQKPATQGNPILQVWQASGGKHANRNVIFVHWNCLKRAMENAMLVYERDELQKVAEAGKGQPCPNDNPQCCGQ